MPANPETAPPSVSDSVTPRELAITSKAGAQAANSGMPWLERSWRKEAVSMPNTIYVRAQRGYCHSLK